MASIAQVGRRANFPVSVSKTRCRHDAIKLERHGSHHTREINAPTDKSRSVADSDFRIYTNNTIVSSFASGLRRPHTCWPDTRSPWPSLAATQCNESILIIYVIIYLYKEIVTMSTTAKRQLGGTVRQHWVAPLTARKKLSLDNWTRTRTSLGRRAFSVSGPSVWNNLPAELRLIDSHPLFRRRLKSHLSDLAFN